MTKNDSQKPNMEEPQREVPRARDPGATTAANSPPARRHRRRAKRASKPSDPNKAVAYLRVSTDRQDLGPDAQRAAISRWANSRGVEVACWHEDRGISGGAEIDKRPGLMAALEALGTLRAGVLVVARRDRLARDVLVSAMVERLCEREGAKIQSADGSGNGSGPEAELMRNIVAAFSAYERAMIRARTRAALAVKRARGERVGTIPFGYRLATDGKHIEECPAEQVVVARARALRAEGLSLRGVGRALLEEGMKPRNGRNWHVQVVARAIEAPQTSALRPQPPGKSGKTGISLPAATHVRDT